MKSKLQHITSWPGNVWRTYLKFWRGRWWHKVLVVFVVALAVILTSMYSIAQWYAYTTRNQPLRLGATFIPDYARALQLDPQKTLDALIDDVGVKQFRFVSYWSNIEKHKGVYDFSDLDWQFRKAEAANAKVSLAIGLRQPRWPECHMPDWAQNEPVDKWLPQLEAFMKATMERYKNSPSLISYQLENEYFNDFGNCPNHDRSRLVREFNYVKHIDSTHPVIVSKSNNFPGGAFGQPQPDIVGVSIYRRVWDDKITKGYFNYPLPSWYYGFNAGVQKIFTGKDSVVHELQMEPWPPHGTFVGNVSTQEQDKSMNASMFADRIQFAKNTGMKSVDLWGAEWWYWRLEHGDPGVWNEAKKVFQNN